MLSEQRSRQYEEETSVIMKTEELHGGQRREVKREADNLYKNWARHPAKPLERETNLKVAPDTYKGV